MSRPGANLGMTAYLPGRYRDSVEVFDEAQRLRADYLVHRDAQRVGGCSAKPDIATEDAPY
jgi:hypothetical protein